MHSGPITQPPSEAGMTKVNVSGNADVKKTSVYLAESHARTDVSVG